MKRLLFVGTYSLRGSKGIYACHADAETGALTLLPEPVFAEPVNNTTYLASHGHWLYAAGETGPVSPRPGAVIAFRRDGSGGALHRVNALPCSIGGPCHVLVFDKGRRLAVSHYKTGEFHVIRLAPDGTPERTESVIRTDGRGPMAGRQDGPHIHSALETPDGRELFSADLGQDRIFHYAIRPEGLKALVPLVCPPGSGPRHMAMSADGAFLWVIGELDSTIIGFKRDRGAFRQIGHWPLLPAEFKGESWAAEIRLHPNGRWIYATNRGADDVTVLAVQPDGSLKIIGRTATGPWPRGMILSPDGRFLYAAAQNGDRIDFYAVDPDSGLLARRGDLTGIPAPVGFAFAD